MDESQESHLYDNEDQYHPRREESHEKSTTNSQNAVDQGFMAWTQVAGSFFLFFNTFGLTNTFGVYQTYYESGQLFRSSSSDISWIGSIQAFLILVIGALTGPMYDAGYLRLLLLIGSFGVVFGHMMLSLCHTYWQVILAQGVVIGLGAGCLFIPAIAVLPGYFSKKIGLAIGIAVSGSSVGGIVYPIAFYRLINEVGFGWGTRILGFMALGMLSIPVLFLRKRTSSSSRRALIDLSAFTDKSFLIFASAGVIGYCSLYLSLFYISYYGEEAHIVSEQVAFYLIPILNAGSIIGRTMPNWLSDKVGPLNIMLPSALVMGLLTFSMIAAKSAGPLIALAVLYGVFSGVYFSLPGVVLVWITEDKSMIGTRVGMAFTIIGLGILAGGPGAGGILGPSPASADFEHMWIFGGLCSIVAGLILAGLRVYRGGWRLRAKV